jgi:hypothetical protein
MDSVLSEEKTAVITSFLLHSAVNVFISVKSLNLGRGHVAVRLSSCDTRSQDDG